MTEHKTPVDQALDLFVYAPIGLALTAAEELPKLVEKGRQQVTSRAAMYKMIGQFAVAHGQQTAERFVRGATDRVTGRPGEDTRSESATRPTSSSPTSSSPTSSSPTSSSPASPSPSPTAPVRSPSAGSSPSANGNGRGRAEGSTMATTDPVADPTADPVAPAPSSDDLAIPGYDALSASQVVQRLAGLSPAELESVRAYEASTRGRKTILSRVNQLQLGS